MSDTVNKSDAGSEKAQPYLSAREARTASERLYDESRRLVQDGRQERDLQSGTQKRLEDDALIAKAVAEKANQAGLTVGFVTRGGVTSSFSKDAKTGELKVTRTSDKDGTIENFVFDKSGKLQDSSYRFPGNPAKGEHERDVQFTYDKAGKIATETSGRYVFEFENGKLVKENVAAKDQSEQIYIDAKGDVKRVEQKSNGVDLSFDYREGHAQSGARSLLGSQNTEKYEFDQRHNVKLVTENSGFFLTTVKEHLTDGRVTSIEFGMPDNDGENKKVAMIRQQLDGEKAQEPPSTLELYNKP